MAPKKRKVAVPRARSQRVIMRDVLTDVKPALASRNTSEVCGACLLPVEPGVKVGIIDSCAHIFHHECVERWSHTENSCPLCKLRFFWLAAYTPDGKRASLDRIERRDQEGEEDNDDFEDIQVCELCKEVGSESALLLCDGMHGTCNAAYHYTCVGLTAVPRGAWFCPDCLERGFDMDARGRRSRQGVPVAAAPLSRDGASAPAPRGGQEREQQQELLREWEPQQGQEPRQEPRQELQRSAIAEPQANEPSVNEGIRRNRNGSNVPPHLRLNALACMTPPALVPAFRLGGGSTSGVQQHEGSGSGANRSTSSSNETIPQRSFGGPGHGNSVFASFVQRRRAQQGKTSASGDAPTGFIKLSPTYEQDFMGGKVTE
uniref:PHD and RING finger domain-containing protein 1 n=1 Tax=Pyrodinium bahamense TaxID=73915 RepID=A0A7S0B8N9_9DINO|mmetsp:Transcript_5474/g.15194  ORF Transcript_5474/g.15194 Transcript_5474/m.15194 type:complete len:374 (+) Transcript_5474:46-1167(+)